MVWTRVSRRSLFFAAVGLVAASVAAAPVLRAQSRPLPDTGAYLVERNLPISGPGGVPLCAMVVRPRGAPAKRPTLLRFTIYADSAADLRQAVLTASHQYISVTGYVRGKMCSPGRPWPYVHDAEDVATIIDWIARQPWSDGRVGMYSGSYEGFTAWAGTKRMPKALKAIMVGAPGAPGIDVPMEGNVVWSFVYPWPFYTTGNRTLDTATYNNTSRWNRLNRQWYVSGRAYRDLDVLDGTPNPVWDEWLAHPLYDVYWQRMSPFREDFARINIPVLQTAGYYYGGPGAAIYYFTEHYKYNPSAEHYLLIGPYDHFGAQRGVVNAAGHVDSVIAGYTIDPVARIDIVDSVRYQWFDYVFKRGRRPALLADRVNYEVEGANVWKHAPSIAAMSNASRRFYLSSSPAGDARRLAETAPARGDSALTLRVNLADRSDVDVNPPGGNVLDTAVDATNGLKFVSDPLPRRTEIGGLFSGRLDFTTNKKDFDFSISLFELTPGGKYLQIPPYQTRASYAEDLTHRRLLQPGKREHLTVRSIRLASLELERGSRLVLVLQVIKNSGQQINYGTGKNVNDETIADAGEPLTIKWFPDSYIEIPVFVPATPGSDGKGQSSNRRDRQSRVSSAGAPAY